MNLTLKKTPAIAYGASPRADLLPPEIRSSERVQATRRAFGLALIAVVVVVVLAFGATAFRAAQAQSGLLASQQRTLAISKEKAKYAEVTTLGDLVATVTKARTYGVSSEIMWNKYFNAISTALPKGVVFVAGAMAGYMPWTTPAAATGPLQAPNVAAIAFTVASRNVLDQTALTRSLSSLTGFAGSSIDSVTLSGGVYAANITVSLSSAALSGRFPAVVAATAVSK